MAETKAATKATAGKAGAKAGVSRPTATVDALDFDTAMDDESFPVQAARRSKWTTLLEQLYEATAQEQVPRGEDEALKFVKLGEFGNVNGARTQIRNMTKANDKLEETYEFKAVVVAGRSQVWARVNEYETVEEAE